MKEDAIIWIIGLIILIAFAMASITLYLWMDEIMKGYFIS